MPRKQVWIDGSKSGRKKERMGAKREGSEQGKKVGTKVTRKG